MAIALFLNLLILGLISGISFLFISVKIKNIYIYVKTSKTQIENHIEEARVQNKEILNLNKEIYIKTSKAQEEGKLQNKEILDLNKEILKESLHALKNIKELQGIMTIIQELEKKINSKK